VIRSRVRNLFERAQDIMQPCLIYGEPRAIILPRYFAIHRDVAALGSALCGFARSDLKTLNPLGDADAQIKTTAVYGTYFPRPTIAI
jgi:hypothetical protein